MRASLLAPVALVSLGVFAFVPAAADPITTPGSGMPALPATTQLCSTPVSVSGIFDQTAAAKGAANQRWAAPGDTVEVDGAGFSQTGCTVTVTVGNVTEAVPASSISPAGTSLTFAAPLFSATSTKGANGPVTVQLHDALSQVASSGANYHFLEQPSAALKQAAPAEGSYESVTGFGFNNGGDPLSVSGAYTGCPGPGAVDTAGSASDDTHASLQVPATYCDGPVMLKVTDPHYDSAPNATDDTPITVSAPAGSVDIPAVVSSVSPSTASPGSFIWIIGSGFGPTGTGAIGGAAAPAGWNDHEISVLVPSGASSGTLLLTRGTGDHATFSAGAVTITPGSGGTGGWTYPTVTGPGVTPPFPTGVSPIAIAPAGSNLPYGAVPPSHAGAPQDVSAAQNSPDRLTISTVDNKTQGKVSGDLNIVVTLLIQNKPSLGAMVSVSLVSSPGSDAKVFPAEGFTDSLGQFHTKLHLSRLAGDHLLVARSGQFADELHVLGQTEATGASIKLPFGNINLTGNPLVVWLSVACFALILLGVVVNINVMRRFVWSVTGGRIVRRLLRRPAPGKLAS